jgi:hypothetical protein
VAFVILKPEIFNPSPLTHFTYTLVKMEDEK